MLFTDRNTRDHLTWTVGNENVMHERNDHNCIDTKMRVSKLTQENVPFEKLHDNIFNCNCV